MKISCPKCGAVSTFDPAKIPDKGAHARCPKCQERMFLKKDGKSDISINREITLPSEKKSRSQPRPMPMDSPMDAYDEYDPDYEPPVVHPDTGVSSGCIVYIAALIVVIAVSAIVMLRKPPEEDLGQYAVRKEPPPKEEVEYYPGHDYKGDLLAIRKKIMKRNYTGYIVKLYGPEFRALDEMLIDCGMECEYFVNMEIIPLKNRTGFEADVYCGEMGHKYIKYNWYTGESECP